MPAYTDEPNDAALNVETVGETIRVSLLNFESCPIAGTSGIPKRHPREGLRKFFDMMYENRDVYLALLEEHLDAVAPPKPGTRKVKVK